jgi:hypothetical protein
MCVTYTSPMSVEPAESAAIRVTWGEPGYLYDLRWYGSPDFIVPVWWIGIIEKDTGELDRTDVLNPVSELPDDVFRWLVPITGENVARQLVSLATSATEPNTPQVSERRCSAVSMRQSGLARSQIGGRAGLLRGSRRQRTPTGLRLNRAVRARELARMGRLTS